MKQPDWIAQARQWFESLPDGDLVEERVALWDQFARQPRPTVTVFGSYDTGKSALLRRLLVDDDVVVPDSLAISAKPETEKPSEIGALGCVLRDTPGISDRHDALRGLLHNAASFSAIGLTDAALLIVNPQLATEEVDSLRRIIELDWPSGALLCVIGRFDEAGLDAEEDLDGYQDLVQRKERELRASFALSDEVPVFVVAQDPFQVAGTETNPDPGIWDEFRSWDGMRALAVAIERMASQDPQSFRGSAEVRFWRAALIQARDELALQLSQHERAKGLASQIAARRVAWLDRLDRLDEAAVAAAEAEIDEAVRVALASKSSDPEAARQQIKDALVLWWRRNVIELDQLMTDVDAAIERQHERPGWDFLESLVIQVSAEPAQGTPARSESRRVSEVTAMAEKALEALKVYNQATSRSAQEAKATGRRGVADGVRSVVHRGRQKNSAFDVGAAIDAGPQAIEALGQVVSLVDQLKHDRAVETERRAEAVRLSGEAARVARATVREALPEWKRLVQKSRGVIQSATQGEEDVLENLDDLIPRITNWIDEADVLLSTATTRSAGA